MGEEDRERDRRDAVECDVEDPHNKYGGLGRESPTPNSSEECEGEEVKLLYSYYTKTNYLFFGYK